MRDVRLDELRGIAIALMVLDHILAVWLLHDGPTWALWLRLSVTRAALPVFMIVSGYLMSLKGAPWPWLRCVQIGVAGIWVTLACLSLGLPTPDILLTLALFSPALSFVVRWPIPTAAVGLVQAFTWPAWWSGYEPGYILALLCLGVLLHRSAAELPRLKVPGAGAFGRRPLLMYVGHFGVLVLAVEVMGW